MELTDLHVDGVSAWIPLDLDLDVEQQTRVLVERFGDDPGTETVATGVAGLAARIAREQDDDIYPLAAWVRTPDDDTLVPLETAVLRALRHPGSDPHELIARLVADTELYSAVAQGELETASGPATTVRYRSVFTTDRDLERQVHEDNAVLWLRAEHGYAVVLSCHSTDLVLAATLPAVLHRLAEGVHGL